MMRKNRKLFSIITGAKMEYFTREQNIIHVVTEIKNP